MTEPKACYLDDLTTIPAPDDHWITRLRRGHFMWLVKEQVFGKVEWAWEPPEPGCRGGRIGLKKCWRNDDQWGTGNLESWYVYPDGRGLDGLILCQPVANNCPDDPPPISTVWQRHVERQLGHMISRLEQLEARVNAGYFP